MERVLCVRAGAIRVMRSLLAVTLLTAVAPAGVVASETPTSRIEVSATKRLLPAKLTAIKARMSEARLRSLADDDIPGVVLGPSPQTGTVSSAMGQPADYVDVYNVTLVQGQIFHAVLSGSLVANDYGYLEGYGPDATSVTGWFDYWPNYAPDNTQYLTIHAERTGTYYLAVWGGTGSYAITHTTTAGGADDFLPGVPLPASPVVGSLNRGPDVRDIYSVELEQGQVLDLALEFGSPDPDDWAYFDLLLYGSGTGQLLGTVPTAETWDLPIEFSYLVPPGVTGTYYLVVVNYDGAGEYSLDWNLGPSNVHRLAGEDRYVTSVEIARATYLASDVAVLATGTSYPDALAASALAGALDAPLLLVRNDVETWAFWRAYDELRRLGVKHVYIVGGTRVVSNDVAIEIRDGLDVTVTRVAGSDRYETARKVADEVVGIVEGQGGAIDGAFLVRGDDFADALAAGPYAFSEVMPVLLTRPGSLSSFAAGFIEDNDIVDVTIVGGTTAVSPAVMGAATALNSGATLVERIAGENRYQTAANLARHAVGRAWATWRNPGVATGRSFPDALSGSAAVGRRGGVLLLTGPAGLNSSAAAALGDHADELEQVLVFGGPAVLFDEVLEEIDALFP